MKEKRSTHSTWKRLLGILLALIMVVGLFPATVSAAEGDETPTEETKPYHHKSVTPNSDGTVTIELNVTGDADTEVETAANVNVVIVYDISQSMTTNVSGTNRSRADNAEDVMHDFIEGLHGYQNGDGDNIEVSLVTFGPNASIRQTWTSDLTGGSNGVNRFFDDGVDGDVIETHNYGSNLGTNWDWALMQANTLLGQLDANDTDPTFVVFVTDGVCTKSGTGSGNGDSPSDENWTNYRSYYEAAATQARRIAERANTTLFGIYAYGTEHDLLDDLIYYANEDSHREMTVGSNTYDIMHVPTNQNNTFDFGATDIGTEDDPLANYFNASDTAKLTQAIESIFQKIVQALGVSSAAISDGTTSAVKTSTDEIANLLNVDESSYKYWLTIPVTSVAGVEGYTFSRVDLVTGDPVEYKVTEGSEAGTYTISWGSSSVTVNGSISAGKLRYQWTGKNALYDFDPPEAVFNGSSVDWDLSPVGTLLDGVTYSVTFDVYPSQTTLDYVADIKNNPYVDEDNPGFWGTLDEEVQKYITKDGGLITNTGATLSYEDTRPDATGGTVVFTDKLDPVSSEAVEQLALSKKWENELDGRTAEPVTLTVTCDGDDKYPVLLNSDNNWENTVFISIGIIRTATGTMEILAPGHDFTFTEPANLSYRWEMNVPTVRPMKIDGEITMLIKVDEKHPLPEDVDEDDVYELPMYDADGKPLTDENGDEVTAVYYVENAETDESAEESSTGFSLTAKNDRRSSLTLTKVISEGAPEGTPEDAEFEFALNIVNSKAPETEPSDDPDHESDYWIWISVWDDDPTVTGAVLDSGTWYYAPSGTDVTIKAHAGCSIRVNNLPTGSTYTITESDSTPGFFFESSELWLTVAKRDDEGHFLDEAGEIIAEPTNSNIVYTDVKAQEFTPSDENELPGDLEYNPANFAFGRETRGTIETTNKLYKVVYTNDYETTDVTVTKAWVDDTDDVRPEELTLTLQREVASATKADGDQEEPADAAAGGPEVVDGVDDPQVTKNEDDTWTYTWEGLPMNDIDGNPYVYTVTEEEVPDDYLCDEPTAEDGGTITNKYGFVNITVEKVWDDDDDQDGIRPESVEVQLQADGQDYGNSWILSEEGAEEVVPAVKADTRDADVTEDDEENEENEEPEDNTTPWTVTFTVPKYDADGEEIDYSVVELDTEELEELGYKSKVTGSVEEGFTITNTHESTTMDIEITKIWEDGEGEDRPESVVVNIIVDPTGEIVDEVELSAEEAEQETDANDEPTTKADAGADEAAEEESTNVWKTVVKVNKLDEGLEYAVGEVEVPGYTSTVEGNAEEGFTITNVKTATITVEKVWDDADDQDGKRPDSIEINLLANGDEYETVTMRAGGDEQEAGQNDTRAETTEETQDEASNKWTTTFNNVPMYADGEKIEYTVEEVEVPTGYKCEVGDPTLNEETGIITITITNEHEPGKTTVTVTKEWDDANDQDGKRPEELTLTLNGVPEGADEPKFSVEKSNDGNTWTYTWSGLPESFDGEKVIYTVTEDKVPDGYEVSYPEGKEAAANGDTITNTHTPETIEIQVVKEWDDADDQDGKRPEELTLTLNGVPEGADEPELDVDKGNGNGNTWTYTWSGLPAYSEGEEIEYTVTEDKVPDGYEVSYPEGKEAAANGDTITNTHTPETFDIQVNKEWDFGENEDVELPESITINLLADGEVVDELELTEDSKWSGTFSGKQKYADSKEIVYTVTEEEVEGFGKPAITGDAEKGFTITNTYAMTALTVIKVWDDGEDPNRPDSIDVTLTNGDFSDKVKISKDDDWTHTWFVPKEEARVYKVTEDVDPNRYYYEDPAFDEETYTFTITNVLLGQGGPGTTTVIIEKVTTGAKTPAATVFKVEGPDGYVKELKYSDFTDGKYELKDVTAGDYTVTEDENTAKVSGYTLKVSGDNGKKMEAEEGTEAVFKITNTYEKEPEPTPEPTPTPTPPSPPTPPTPPTPPELNKEDHFAYIIGNDEGLVLPAANITRAEVATIFFRMLTDESRDEYWSQTNGFSDVFPEEWFNNAVSTMANAGILKGYEDGTFRPRASITRAEFATIAIRFFQDFTSTETYFSDVSGHWGEAYINMAAEKGLIKGYPDSTFRPNAAITRAEAMAIMNRLLERHPHEDHLLDGMITWPDNMDTDAWYYADVQEATNSHEYANGINGYEIWTKILPVRDWAAFEREWSTAHSASNPGDVVDKDFSLDLSDLEDVDEDSGEPNEDDQDEEDEENDDRYIEEKNTDDQDEEDQDTDDQNNEDQDSGDDQNADGQSRN